MNTEYPLTQLQKKEYCTMKKICIENEYSYVFSAHKSPVAIVEPGEMVEVYTIDTYGGRAVEESDWPANLTKIPRPGSNPLTGPIYINGVKPGDALAVHIHKIEPTTNYGMSHVASTGTLSPSPFTNMITPGYEHHMYKYLLDGDRVYCPTRPHLSFDADPFLGCMATAPILEDIYAVKMFEFGGNMDVPDVKAGNTVYFPVAVEGAYFYTGDAHAKQGHGEVCGVAVEIAAKVTLSFEIVKNMNIKHPRIESPTHYMAVGIMRPLEDAGRMALTELIEWMAEKGWDKVDAYQMLSQVVEMHPGNLVSAYYSMVAMIEKRYADYFINHPD